MADLSYLDERGVYKPLYLEMERALGDLADAELDAAARAWCGAAAAFIAAEDRWEESCAALRSALLVSDDPADVASFVQRCSDAAFAAAEAELAEDSATKAKDAAEERHREKLSDRYEQYLLGRELAAAYPQTDRGDRPPREALREYLERTLYGERVCTSVLEALIAWVDWGPAPLTR